MKTIYNLELHEELDVHPFLRVTRVAGGWVYSSFTETEDYKVSITFVPFSNEFQTKQD